MRTARRLGAIAAALAAAACTTPPPPASQVTVDAHVARATATAGDDLKHLLRLCQPQPGQRPSQAAVDQLLERAIALPPPEHGQVFDNLYFVGSSFVSAWVLKTSDGLILIDALNNALEAQSLIEGGMRKLGLDPAQIKYVIITHGHGDHYGGAPMLVQKYGTRAVASESDWKMMETGLEFDSPFWGRPPKRDIAIKDGDRLTLGDTTVALYVTPGHTLGTISPVFDVKAGGRSYKALLWGGTAFNFGRDMDRLDHYVAQTQRMERLAARSPIDVMLSNHPSWDDLVAKMAKLRVGSSGAHPFVSGREVVGRSLRVMEECARAQQHRFRILLK